MICIRQMCFNMADVRSCFWFECAVPQRATSRNVVACDSIIYLVMMFFLCRLVTNRNDIAHANHAWPWLPWWIFSKTCPSNIEKWSTMQLPPFLHRPITSYVNIVGSSQVQNFQSQRTPHLWEQESNPLSMILDISFRHRLLFCILFFSKHFDNFHPLLCVLWSMCASNSTTQKCWDGHTYPCSDII